MQGRAVGILNASGIGAVRVQRWVKLYKYTGLLEMIVGVLTTCHKLLT